MNFIPYSKQIIEDDDVNNFIETLKSDFLTTGLKVNEFERKIYEISNAKYCVSVSNGTAALHLSALALLNKGDRVLTTPNSFIATANSILYAKATPVFVDICSDGSIDLDLCEDILKKDTSIKAIFAVSFSGKILDRDRLKYLKHTYNIKILEDNAHAMGAKLTYSDISTFSFHPVKHITTGEGGAVVTNDKALYEKIKMLRNHGQDDMHQMLDLGFNYRLSDISSTLGLSQIKKLDTFIHKRQEIGARYDKAFQGTLVKPLYPYTDTSLYHLYVVRIDFSKLDITKNEVMIKMREKSIGVQVHYKPINKQPYYKSLGYGNEQTPMMDKYIEECLSIPCYPTLSKDQQQYVVDSLLEVLNA